ncbi:MAG: hypothetical protein JWL61_4046 [Gemmatimonadetes bacterium]|nr:hypothetical protein [Gemmatimonadota bacterium]
MPPTADNLNEMTWSERRRLDQEHFNALRAASQEQINERLRRGGMLPEECTPMTTAEAGASYAPIPTSRPITVRDVVRTLDNRSPR